MLTLSRTDGIGGTIKNAPEDFVVEEITKKGITLEIGKMHTKEELGFPEAEANAKFTIFVLQKRDWNTVQALRTVARKARRGIKSVGFAGTKDRTSISTQLCSLYGVKPSELLSIHVKDLSINGAWAGANEVRMGELSGNRFTVVIRDVETMENVEKINAELNGIFPNYFGEQRFGTRNNNVDIGIDIMKADFKSAVTRFLTDTSNEGNDDAVDARKRLSDNLDFKDALNHFPDYLKYERQMLEHLSSLPTDYAGAIRRLPRSLSLMFVHSVESYVFNIEVERHIERNGAKRGIEGNIVGYDIEINELEKQILDEIGITQEQFRVKSMPELNCKGGKRLLFAPYTGFSHSAQEKSVKMQFSLPSGSYATVLMNEFMKGNDKE